MPQRKFACWTHEHKFPLTWGINLGKRRRKGEAETTVLFPVYEAWQSESWKDMNPIFAFTSWQRFSLHHLLDWLVHPLSFVFFGSPKQIITLKYIDTPLHILLQFLSESVFPDFGWVP